MTIDSLPACFATPSLGMHENHTLPMKLRAASEAGFKLVELAMDDLVAWTLSEQPDTPRSGQKVDWAPDEPDPRGDEALWSAIERQAHECLKLLGSLGLGVLLLQPFSQAEGWAPGSDRREWTMAKAEHWLRIGEIVKAQAMQIGSNDVPESSSDKTQLAADLAEFADMARTHGMMIAYENWCWAAHNWEACNDLVQRADRDNLKLCLDTFQTGGGPGFGDPTTESGWAAGDAQQRLTDSLDLLSRTVPPERILLLQISDAYKMTPPIGKGNKVDGDGDKPREIWSRGHRPLPYHGGYLPVEQVTRAVLKTGSRCVLSYEVFDQEAQSKDDSGIPSRWARDGMAAHRRLVEAAGAGL